jgi:DNA-binding response OmpR family regulator
VTVTDSTLPRVLCVEDDAATAVLITRGLGRRGYRVDVVPTGSEGLSRFAAEQWEVVLIDQQLPDIPGIDVLVTMSKQGRLPATIMVTGRGNEGVAATALKLGAHDYLVKDAAESYLALLPEVVEKARALVRQREEVAAMTAERERLVAELTEALAKIRTLSGLLPICAACKSIRNEQGAWESLESYLTGHSDAMLSHGLCPPCLRGHYPDLVTES